MMKLKQILTLLTAAGMSLVNIQPVQVTMPAAALTASAANSGSCGENVTWTLNNGVLTISGTGAMDDQDLPNTFSSLNFSKAVIMDGVTTIGKMSFERCFGLKSVTIPSSVTSIGFQAFYQCTSLTDIKIPESVTSFAADVFNETPWLEAKQKENPLVVINDILIDGSTCSGEVTIPDGIKCIGTFAFDLCKELTGVRIPESVTSIEGGAFASCWELKSITIPKSVTCIDASTFSRCSSLTDVRIPNSVTSIGASAFYSCYALTDIQIPDSVTSIGDAAFQDCSKLTSITIPGSVTSISDWAFSGCKKLTIKGVAGSYAESFAKKNNIPFEVISGSGSGTTNTATTPVTTTTTVTTPTKTEVQSGDINGDDTISVEDAQFALLAYVQIMAGLDSGLTERQIKAADINGDNTVSVEDAQLILLYYVSNTLSGQNVTWDELLGKNKPSEPLPFLLKLKEVFTDDTAENET